MLALPRASVLSVANSELFEKLREELSTLDSWLVCFFSPTWLFLFYLFMTIYPILSMALQSVQI